MDEALLVITEGKRPECNIVDQLARLIHKKNATVYRHSDLLTLIATIEKDEHPDYGTYLRGVSVAGKDLPLFSLVCLAPLGIPLNPAPLPSSPGRCAPWN